MAQPKLLTWNPKQLSIYQKLQAGMTTADIATEEEVSKATVTKVSNAMKKGQSPANAYIKPQFKGKKFPEPDPPVEKALSVQAQSETGSASPGAAGGNAVPPSSKPASGNASLLALKQISMSCALTPIMLNARHTAITHLHWKEDISWEDFFDTVCVLAFRYWGYGLMGVYKLDGSDMNGSPKPASEKPSGNGSIDKDKAAALGYAMLDILKEKAEAIKAT